MKKLTPRVIKPGKTGTPGFWPGLIILSALFLAGAVAGCLTAARVGGRTGQAMTSYLQEYLTLFQDRPATGSLLGSALLGAFKYHAAVFLLGLTIPGVALIPLVLAVRGFFLSFTITAFARVFGMAGIWLSAGAFGVQALLTLPCLFFLAMSGLGASASLLGAVSGKNPKPAGKRLGRSYFLPFAFCSSVLCVSALFEAFITPSLLSWIAGLVI